ncbi:hypothetical protein O181_015270 [Austropuccinia psidii MF-1]|uniref:Uncharacterized protein n=1 Tax=Austropuccinia psidii MF-1 TaxID=1389203 RepID=A0A9Q3GQS2_9BASI|nr:hypothetical protein [Austropuccinia psidii MF-1]
MAPNEPSQHYDPPIPRPSQSSKSQVTSHEDGLTHEPEPEVAPMQSTEEPFAHPATPCSVIIINDTPIGSPWRSQLPPPPIAMMRLGRNLPTCD